MLHKIWVRIQSQEGFFDILLPNSKPILVGIIYRPPDQSGFLGKLTEANKNTEKFDEQEVYILGDFNIQ